MVLIYIEVGTTRVEPSNLPRAFLLMYQRATGLVVPMPLRCMDTILREAVQAVQPAQLAARLLKEASATSRTIRGNWKAMFVNMTSPAFP